MSLLLIHLAQSLLLIVCYLLWQLAMHRGQPYRRVALLVSAGALAGALLTYRLRLAGSEVFFALILFTLCTPVFFLATRLWARRFWWQHPHLRALHPVAARRLDAMRHFLFGRLFPAMALLVQLLSIWQPEPPTR